jgi:hypothetical protein
MPQYQLPTSDQISNMPVPQLKLEIAVHLFGYKWYRSSYPPYNRALFPADVWDNRPDFYCTEADMTEQPVSDSSDYHEAIPDWPCDISEAWAVVEQLHSACGMHMMAGVYRSADNPGACVAFDYEQRRRPAHPHKAYVPFKVADGSKAMAEAICRAGLMAFLAHKACGPHAASVTDRS